MHRSTRQFEQALDAYLTMNDARPKPSCAPRYPDQKSDMLCGFRRHFSIQSGNDENPPAG